MEEKTYTLEGWLAIVSGCLVLPGMVMAILADTAFAHFGGFKLLWLIVSGIQMGLSIYVFYRFRDFLHDRFQFHAVDTLIPLIIAGSCLIFIILSAGRIVTTPEEIRLKILFIIALVLVGIPTSILGIIFAVKLLGLPDNLHGLLKPYAYLTIISMVFFLTIILGFLGAIVAAVTDILLGMIYLRSNRPPDEVEFV
ncbi:MAG TPA: hypothetical protein PK014_12850 [Thermoanaerobaculia bacterium]|nr:hypothetical protein [Thermoanaerobaculia bacterium]HUM30980.1 hypothetical protein [Thermoanaerobaculia bacterium]HXK69287.1 hypothetical protein [Thermoanaerobaculia bacterium]